MHRLGGLEPRFRKEVQILLTAGKHMRLNARITSGYRTMQQQHHLNLREEKSFPVAPPGQSLHQYGLEVDIVSDDNNYLGQIWTAMGHHWGGFRDPIAFAL